MALRCGWVLWRREAGMLLSSVVWTVVILASVPAIFPARLTAQTTSPSVSEEQDFTFASGLYRDGLYQLAAEQFEKFLEKYPRSLRGADAQFLTAESYFHLAQYLRSANEYSRFIRAFPQSQTVDDAWFRIGQANLRAKKTDEAVAAFKTVLDKFPASELAGESAYWIGEAYLKNDDDNNAIKYYTLAYENYPNSALRNFSLYSIGWAYQHKGDYSRGLDWYNRLVKEFPGDTLASAAQVHRGECYFYAKEYHQAIRVLREAIGTIGPVEERGEAEYLIAESMYRLGDLPSAQNRYEKFLSEYAGHRLEREVRYALGWCYLQQKNYAQAIRTFEAVEEGNDAIAHAGLYRKGTAESLQGNKREALKVFEQVVLRDPQGEFSDNALFDAGMISYGEENTDTAKACFLRVVKEYPSSDVLAETHRMIGECFVRESNYTEAIPWFEKAAADSAVSFDVKVAAMYQTGWSLYKARKYNEASSRFTEFLALYPIHPKAYEAQFWLAECEYQQGDFDSALTGYKNVAAVHGGSKREEGLYGVAWSYFKLANYPAAIDGFEKLLTAYPKGNRAFDARNRLGDAYFFQKDYKRAAGSYRVAIRFAADTESVDYASYQLAQCLFRSGDLSGSYEQFSGLIKAFPKSPFSDDAQYALGWINFQRKEYGDAIQEFQKLPKEYPRSDLVPRALYSLGDSYYNMK
ncbi:MAG: tetratricopeptide repeat protein, partial [Bacteroidota bacterium]